MPAALSWSGPVRGVDADDVEIRVVGRADPSWWGGVFDGSERPGKVVVTDVGPGSDGRGLVLSGLAAAWAECRWANTHPAQVAAGLAGRADAPEGLWPGIGCAHLVLVTADDRVVVTRRSADVAFYPGAWSASCEEQLEAGVDATAGDAARRCVTEEFGLGAGTVVSARVLEVFREFDDDDAALGIVVVVAVHLTVTAADLAAAVGVDSWERDRIAFIARPDAGTVMDRPSSVLQVGFGPVPDLGSDRWHPTSRRRLELLVRSV